MRLKSKTNLDKAKLRIGPLEDKLFLSQNFCKTIFYKYSRIFCQTYVWMDAIFQVEASELTFSFLNLKKYT
jgi:hypothetical protein